MYLHFFGLLQPGDNEESGGLEGEDVGATVFIEAWLLVLLIIVFAWVWYLQKHKKTNC